MQSVHFGWSIKFSLFIRFTSAALYTQMFFNEVNVIDGYEQMDAEGVGERESWKAPNTINVR